MRTQHLGLSDSAEGERGAENSYDRSEKGGWGNELVKSSNKRGGNCSKEVIAGKWGNYGDRKKRDCRLRI